MHFVIIVTLIVVVCGREIPEDYYPVPHNERYERRYIQMPHSEIRQDNRNRQIVLNNHEHNRHAAGSDLPNIGQDQTDDGVTKITSINLAFERQINQNRHGNINLPRQSFSIDTQYPNSDFANNQRNGDNQQNRHIDFNNYESAHRSNNAHPEFDGQRSPVRGGITNTPRSVGTKNEYPDMHDTTDCERQGNNKPNDKQPTRQQDEMIFNDDDEYNKRKALDKTNQKDNSVRNANHPIDRNSNQNTYNTRHNNRNKNIDVSGSPDKVYAMDQIPSKTTIENEVTPDPFQDDSIRKEHRTTSEQRWIWGDNDKLPTITTVTPPTLDDRAAFAGDKCATGMARVAGKCIQTDK